LRELSGKSQDWRDMPVKGLSCKPPRLAGQSFFVRVLRAEKAAARTACFRPDGRADSCHDAGGTNCCRIREGIRTSGGEYNGAKGFTI